VGGDNTRRIFAICFVLLLLAGICAAYYTRGTPDSSAIPGKRNPTYNAMMEKLFYWNGDYRNIGDIIIESRAQQGAKVLGHGLLQEVERLGAQMRMH
jgi:hypothetical protein